MSGRIALADYHFVLLTHHMIPWYWQQVPQTLIFCCVGCFFRQGLITALYTVTITVSDDEKFYTEPQLQKPLIYKIVGTD